MGLWVACYEVKNIDLDIINAIMRGCTEVFAHVGIKFGVCDLGKVFTHPRHESAFCLAHILVLASVTFYAIDDIGTLAGHIRFSAVRPVGGLRGDAS